MTFTIQANVWRLCRKKALRFGKTQAACGRLKTAFAQDLQLRMNTEIRLWITAVM